MKVRDVMHGEVVTVAPNDDVGHALQIMLWRGFRHLPVVRDARLVGVLSERDILAGRLEDTSFYAKTRQTVEEVMSTPPQRIHPNADLSEAAGLMTVHKLGCLPVVVAGQVVGIVTTTDLLGHLAQCEVPNAAPEPAWAVGDLMTRTLVAARPDDVLLDAVGSMVQHGVRHLPVVDVDDRIVGMLSDRDVRTAIGDPLRVLQDEQPATQIASMHVRDAMTPAPRVLDPDAPLSDAVLALLDDRFGALPIVDDEGKLVGMLSYLDVLRGLAQRLLSSGTP